MTDTTQPPAETLAVRHVPQAWIDRAMQIEAAAEGLVSMVNDAIQRAEEGSGRLYAANRVQLGKWSTQVLEAINLPESVFVDSLTRRAGGDAIPAGDASAEEAAECWLDENVAPRHSRDRDYGADDMIDAFIAGRESATPKPPAGGDAGAMEDIDSPAARLEMVRAALHGILDNPSHAKAYAKAGLDLLDLTSAERAIQRGEAV